MWGRHLNVVENSLVMRNTPTHVGKTLAKIIMLILQKKHPHACGEDDSSCKLTNFPLETPPRMWGRRTTQIKISVHFGNTPTHVGKTLIRPHRHAKTWKHPHACGEDSESVKLRNPNVETPPRMWGRLDPSTITHWADRNTPTHVGKTLF